MCFSIKLFLKRGVFIGWDFLYYCWCLGVIIGLLSGDLVRGCCLNRKVWVVLAFFLVIGLSWRGIFLLFVFFFFSFVVWGFCEGKRAVSCGRLWFLFDIRVVVFKLFFRGGFICFFFFNCVYGVFVIFIFLILMGLNFFYYRFYFL